MSITIEELAAKIQRVEDIQEINKLENLYGYYLDGKMWNEVIDLFSDQAISLEVSDRGLFKGKEGVRRFFSRFMKSKGREDNYGWIVIHHQLQGTVDVAPDGKTAKGRWYLLTITARDIDGGIGKAEGASNLKSCIGHAVYENEFIKEDGKWKFLKVQMSLHFMSPIEGGWTQTPVVGMGRSPESDAPVSFYHPYPNLELLPLHWDP